MQDKAGVEADGGRAEAGRHGKSDLHCITVDHQFNAECLGQWKVQGCDVFHCDCIH